MNYSHRSDGSRQATIVLDPPKDGKHNAVARWVDDAGKERKKSFKKPYPSQAEGAAALFLLKEGFILRAPQTGPLEWMTAIHEPYPHGFPLAVQPDTGAIWIGGTGALIRVEPGSCAETKVPVGEGVMVRSVGCSREGHVLAVLDLDGGGPIGDPPWRAPARGPFAYGLVSVLEGERIRLIGSVPHEASAAITAGLSVSDSGRFVGPHVDGAALYEANGTLVRAFVAARTEHTSPVVALSPNARWAAVTHEGGAIRLMDLIEDTERVLPGSFSQVHSIRVADDGSLLVGGFIYPSWGVYRVAVDAQPVRLFESMGAALSPEGDAAIEVGMDCVRKLDLFTASEDWPEVRMTASFPALCGGSTGAVHLLPGTRVLVATRGHTLACIDLAKLGET